MERIEWREKREERGRMSLQFGVRLPRAYGHRFLETCNRGPRHSSWEFWGCNPLENSSTFDSATRYINIRHPIRHISNLEPYSNTLESSRNKSKNITNQSWKYPKYSTNLFHSDPKDIKITSQLRHKASSSKVTKSSNEKKKKRKRKKDKADGQKERERMEDGERSGEARTARVWSINHGVFPATGGHRGRWRGHIIGRIVPVCWSAGRTVIYLVAIDRASTARLDSS